MKKSDDFLKDKELYSTWLRNISYKDTYLYTMISSKTQSAYTYEVHNEQKKIYLKLFRYEVNYKIIVISLDEEHDKFFEKSYIVSKNTGERMIEYFQDEVYNRSTSIDNRISKFVLNELKTHSEEVISE